MSSAPRMRTALPLLFVSLILGCRGEVDPLVAKSRRVFGTRPRLEATDSKALVRLGRAFYFSPALSLNGTQSCASCHPVGDGAAGADQLAVSPGALGTPGRRNTPTVLNAAAHVAQFWDGRAATLEDQAVQPILNPIEMAMPGPEAVEERLRRGAVADPALIRRAFPGEQDPFTLKHVGRAIAAFERTLVTTDRFDAFLEGDAGALTEAEKRGLDLFLRNGCASCHGGPLLGGDRYQKAGIIHPYEDRSDTGRYEVTLRERDRFVFKVPSLRNVALTAPYFHDGRVDDLGAAVERMAWMQLGRRLSPAERDALVAFLESLSDPELLAAEPRS